MGGLTSRNENGGRQRSVSRSALKKRRDLEICYRAAVEVRKKCCGKWSLGQIIDAFAFAVAVRRSQCCLLQYSRWALLTKNFKRDSSTARHP